MPELPTGLPVLALVGLRTGHLKVNLTFARVWNLTHFVDGSEVGRGENPATETWPVGAHSRWILLQY